MSGFVAAAVVTVAATAYSVTEQSKAAKAQKRQQEVQNRVNERRNQYERQQNLNQARIQAAQVTNSAAVGGFGGSSADLGSVSSIGTQGAVNANFIDQNTQDMREAVAIGGKIADHMSNANIASAVASLSSLGMQTFGGKRGGSISGSKS